MTAKKTILTMLVMALSVGLLAACGGDDSLSDQEYSDKLAEAIQPLAENQNLGTDISNSKDLDEFVTNLEETKSVLNESASTLEGISPPSDVEEENNELITAFNDFSTSLDPVIDAAEGGDEKAIEEEAAGVQTAAQDFATTFQDVGTRLEEAGIPEPDVSVPAS